MAKPKRKREGGAAGESAAAAARERRMEDPYALQTRACRPADHQRKKSKGGVSQVRNCADNPNCLYGLGERQKGIWNSKKMIQRVFGDDPRERRRATAQGETQTLVPCGLRNLGATCYLNSMLQCLFVNQPFRRAVYEWEPKEQDVNEQQVLQMRALQKLFAQMQLGNQNLYDPTEFASTLALNNVVQQDAQEFNKLLLTHLRTIFSQSCVSEHWDLVDRVFQGHMSYATKCLRCKTRSLRPSTYYEISLNIKGHKTLSDSIASYLSAEILDGDNKYYCDNCKSKECAERYMELDPKKLPDTITFQLMRFVYDAAAGRKKKLMDVIEVAETLNMTDLLRQSGNAEAFEETNDVIYRLSGYLNHRGKSAHVGHYTASVAYPAADASDSSSVVWYEFDDALVNAAATATSPNASEHQGKKLRSRDIYMLLYVREPSSSANAGTQDLIQPSLSCRESIETENAVFEADVQEYACKVKGMEERISERVKAYEKFFEKEHPYPDPSAAEFYWVDTLWLRNWITGEEEIAANAHTPAPLPDAEKVDAAVLASGAVDLSQTNDDREDEGKTDEGDSPADAIVIDDDENMDQQESSSDASTPLREQDIPFSKPIDISSYCCMHSRPVARASDKDEKPEDRRVEEEKPAQFSPDIVPQLKRISAKLFKHLKMTCGTDVSSLGSPAGSISRSAPLIFAAPTYRCAACEQEFRGRLSDDAEQLKEVELELGFLKTGASQPQNGYYMSRAWIASYKAHLQKLHKGLFAIANKKAKANGGTQQDLLQYCASGDVNVSSGGDEPIWLAPLNADITCMHGNLVLDKRKYRVVPSETWMYFASKFAPTQVFIATNTETCPECQHDVAATEEIQQIERASRDQVLERAPLAQLYRKKTGSGSVDGEGGSFLLSEVFALSGTHGTRGSKSDATSHRRMFIVPRSWMSEWRKYIRDVDYASPSPLSMEELLCPHKKLLLPQSVLRAIDGAGMVDQSELGIEFVSQDEMVHLVDLYGDANTNYYYALLNTSRDSVDGVLWRKCSYASLLFASQMDTFGVNCPEDVIPLECEDDNEDSVRCVECESSARELHRFEMENFENRIVNVQLLLPDQPVPVSGSLSAVADVSGRRRSKRIRPGSASTWLISANATDNVYMLKTKIYSEIGALPVRQRLYFKGEVLEDYRTLKECGIKAGDAVFMRLSEDNSDDLALEETQSREVGFEDSVFLSHTPSTASAKNGRNTRPNAAASSSDMRVWVCTACTYVNDDSEEQCEMCTTPRAYEVE